MGPRLLPQQRVDTPPTVDPNVDARCLQDVQDLNNVWEIHNHEFGLTPDYALSHTRVYLLMLLSSCGGFMWLPRMV